jgi:hypothetical protein
LLLQPRKRKRPQSPGAEFDAYRGKNLGSDERVSLGAAIFELIHCG